MQNLHHGTKSKGICVTALPTKYEGDNLLNLFVFFYIIKTCRLTYSHHLPPISMDDLAINSNIKPPITLKQVGRPCTKRIRKGP